jgi:hypothetical protein
MSTVTGIRESQWDKNGEIVTTYWIGLDGKEVPSYDAAAKNLKLNEALPEGWEVRQSKAGKDYLKPPGKGGGGGKGFGPAAWRNTEVGARAEQRSIHASVALTQAVAATVDPGSVLAWADKFFAWLTDKTSAAATAGATGVGNAEGHRPTPEVSDAVGKGGSVGAHSPSGQTDGEGPKPAGECDHLTVSETKPDGRPLPPGRSRCVDCGVVL